MGNLLTLCYDKPGDLGLLLPTLVLIGDALSHLVDQLAIDASTNLPIEASILQGLIR